MNSVSTGAAEAAVAASKQSIVAELSMVFMSLPLYTTRIQLHPGTTCTRTILDPRVSGFGFQTFPKSSAAFSCLKGSAILAQRPTLGLGVDATPLLLSP